MRVDLTQEVPDRVRTRFAEWKKEYNVQYSNDEEHGKRLLAFYENWQFYNEWMSSNEIRSYTIALNKFADLTNEEFVAKYVNNGEFYRRERPLNTVVLPETEVNSIDWRDHGAVTPVKDQK